jgi:AmmeMemoRadiSam system protein A
MISSAEQKLLLEVARSAIEATLKGNKPPRPPAEGRLARPAAAFVSLHMGGELRGCIGHLEEDGALVHTVAECARLACTEDPRFPAVTASEMDRLEVEISVLGPFQRVTSLHEVVVGRHGLLIEHQGRRGLLLPQVATEFQWTAHVFVEQTCGKAGLPRDSWSRGATLYRFEAEVFGKR